MSGYNNYKRIIHRCIEELDATRRIAKVTSIREGLETFRAKIDIQIINRNGYCESKIQKKHLLRKHEIIMKYFEKKYKKFIDTYKFDEQSLPENSNYKNKIWICWWQGINNAPEIVKKCVSSICSCVAPYEVIILDNENYRNYVNIPEWLISKREQGFITNTHFSDILRCELLAEHGGIWLDATFFATDFKVDEIFELPVWSIKRPDYGHLSVACGRFANYSLACNFENRKAFAIIRDYLYEYWKVNDRMIDYLFLDYLIELALRHNHYLKEMFDNIPKNNPKCDDLYIYIYKEYDEKVYEMLKENTSLFKLSWKNEYVREKNGCLTFYGKIMSDVV